MSRNGEKNETDETGAVRRLTVLLEITKAVTGEVELEGLMMTLAEKAAAAVGGERGAVFLFDEDTDEFWSIAATGESEEIRFPADRGIAGHVARTGESLIVHDAYADPRFNVDVDKKTGYRTRDIICAPILEADGECIGVVEVLNKADGAFDEDDVDFLEAISGQAAAAIRNVRLFEERKRMFDSLIDVLGDSIESRDPYTAGHSREVMRYSVGMAEEMGLDEDEVEVIKYAALLHDYGKIGIPDEILGKPNRLTEDEFEIIKQHVVYSREILGKIAFEKKLRMVPEIAGGHHERLTGGGYPDGLSGEEIPLGSRIIAVADAFQAMTTDRPYRRAMTPADAVSELKAGVGVDYDGEAVNALVVFLVKNGVLEGGG
jgi:putative nucleotidyltransferase with HDIG domain